MALDRRTLLLAGAAGMIAPGTMAADTSAIPVLDTHCHLWDITRPQGAPYPPKVMNGLPTKAQMLPPILRQELAPQGIVGAIAVDAGPWIEDNLWITETVLKDTYMVGVVGRFSPNAKDFPSYIERFRKFPVFFGIRHGDVAEDYNIAQWKNPATIQNLKVLADAGLVLEVGNPKLDLLQAMLYVNDAIPTLRIIVNHMGGFFPAAGEAQAYDVVLREYEKRAQIYGKISAFSISRPEIPVSTKLADHNARLDHLIASFGEDRVMGGGYSTVTLNTYRPDLTLLREYHASKPRQAAEKFFWRNSINAYKWVKREPGQPSTA